MEPPSTPPVLLGLTAVVVLVLANAFFVAAEFALVGARRTRLDEMAKAGDRKARLARRPFNHSTATSSTCSVSRWPWDSAGSASPRWPT